MTRTIRRRFAGAALALALPGGAAALAANTALVASTAVGGAPSDAPNTPPTPRVLKLLLRIDDPTEPASTAPMGEIAARP